MDLFEEVKLSLDYENIDDFTQRKINQFISKGKQHLRLRAPDLNDSDFEDVYNHAHSLLLDYCRYANSNATEDFDKNYRGELLSLRQDYEVRAFEQKQE